MKIYNFGKDMGQEIKAFDSKNLIMTGMIDATDKIRMGCMHVDAGGIVGFHQASVSQLFAVVAGEGVVKGKEDKEYSIKAGYAAYWEAGEWHETRTEAGLTAIVIEGVALKIKLKEEE
ncbi:cupin domain-containing protein [Paenibacillus thiaminolyticus]|uniref:cupin domain-containing protein n=1 Tax=Paenibacillus thiaminolyticus TaxID=49283 RepID=UPI00232C67D9|nr:cupin domain-containing protein [Paenibacillus thiaminolyticus]WCF05885.1 cupin domain-containing protein [Paenibacillus thiaminolyticus]